MGVVAWVAIIMGVKEVSSSFHESIESKEFLL